MAKREDEKELYERWNISVTPEEAFQDLLNKVLIAVDRSAGGAVALPEIQEDLALRSGVGLMQLYNSLATAYDGGFFQTIAHDVLCSAASQAELAVHLEHLFAALGPMKSRPFTRTVNAVRKAIELSPFAGIRLVRHGRKVSFYPAGAPSLDESVVNRSLSWLRKHPTVLRHYGNALEIAAGKDAKRYGQALNELRLAFGGLVRRVLQRRSNLANLKSDLGQWLEARGIVREVREMYAALLAHFVAFQNEYSKHERSARQWREVDIEFFVYLTGTLMRLILQLEQKAKVATK